MIIINFNAILNFSFVYLPSYVFIHTKWSYNFFLFQSSIKPKYTHIYYHYIIIIIICIWFNYEHLFTFIAFVVSIFPNSTIYFYLFILIFKIFSISIEKLHKKKFQSREIEIPTLERITLYPVLWLEWSKFIVSLVPRNSNFSDNYAWCTVGGHAILPCV